MNKVIYFLLCLFISCNSDTSESEYVEIGYDLGKLRGETNSLIKLRDNIAQDKYPLMIDSLVYQCGVVGRKAHTIRLTDNEKERIDAEIEDISNLLKKSR